MGDNQQGRDRRMIEKVGEYLKSDSYMFATQTVTSPGYAQCIKRVNVEVSTRTLTRNDNQSTVESSNLTVEDQYCEVDLTERSMPDQQNLVQMETVKHMAYQSCHSSSMSGKEMPDSQLKKLGARLK